MDPRAAASLLLANWAAATRIPELPGHCRPRTRAEGYVVAAAIETLSGQRVAGWKIAATSEAGQRHINVDGPLAGRILANRLLASGASIALGDNIMRVAEGEFAFSFGRDLPPRGRLYSERQALDAVAGLHLSIEIPDSRYQNFTRVGEAQLIADTACASWLILGPAATVDWRELDLATCGVVGFRNGVEAGRGTGAAALGGPAKALTWFVNEASRHLGGVEAGQFVTTGTCLVPLAISPGDHVTMDYGRLGSIAVSIA